MYHKDMKVFALSALLTAALSAQDARQITLIQEHEAMGRRAAARIEHQTSRAPATAPQQTKRSALSPADAAVLRKAMERLAPCLTGKLTKDPDSPLYVPEVDEACLAGRP
jgi:hypothetical protein